MDSIRGFIPLSDDLYCSGQPTESELAFASRKGVKFVLNLAMPDSDYALPDERGTVESLGMAFSHIPVPFSAPTVEHFLQFEQELLVRPGQRTLVHCALNWRASSFVALFAERHLEWNLVRSEELRRALWTPNETWNRWAELIRALPPAERLASPPGERLV